MESQLKKQYDEVLQKYPDSIVLFKCDEFYETFAESATIISTILEIPLTTSRAGDLLAGFHMNKIDVYLPKLVKEGYRVAIVENPSYPRIKNEIKRK